MGKIKILSDHIANRIAAGEVVERPSSVVKELVENSIDADASRIDVQVESGGKDVIIVTDNGSGIPSEDIELALQRHATSKIDDVEDLHHISTLGFRGEALPSIASISRMELVSRVPDNELAMRIVINQGVVEESGEVGAPLGTTVKVNELFFNTPARRKFLKSAVTEYGHILDTVERIAAGYPRIAFTLKHGTKLYLDLPEVSTYEERLAGLWGEERIGDMLEVEAGEPGIAVFGFAAPPSIHWNSAKNMRFVLNGRPIINKILNAAVRRAYETTLPSGRYPQVMLYLEIDPELVDVNVHPMKLEVRFRRSDDIFKAVVRAIRSAISPGVAPTEIRSPVATASRESLKMKPPEYERTEALFEPQADFHIERPIPITEREIYATPHFVESARIDDTERVAPTFWQVHQTYIIAETKNGILVIDQHAAHERVLFDEIRRRVASKPGGGQRLLFPIAIRLTGQQETILSENRKSLENLGFEFGPIVPGHVMVEAVPQEITHFGKGEMLLEILDDLSEGGSGSSALDDFAAMAACHMAIKAGDNLSQEEMAQLFDRLFATEKPYTCPHGRPTLIRIELVELDKKFARK